MQTWHVLTEYTWLNLCIPSHTINICFLGMFLSRIGTTMSKLLERLEQVNKGPVRALGFAPRRETETLPTMLLLAWADGASKQKLSKVSSGADALVLPLSALESSPSKSAPPEGAVWGIAFDTADGNLVEIAKEKGGDFVIFNLDGVLVDYLSEGDVARVLQIHANLDDSLMRGLEDLPVDVILLKRPEPQGPLSLTHMLAISNVRSAISRYMLLEWDAGLTSHELEQLNDMGIDGIVANLGKMSPSAIGKLKENIDKLPPRKARNEQKLSPTLPRAQESAPLQHHHEEEEEEELEEEF